MNLLVDVFAEDIVCCQSDARFFIPQLFSYRHTIRRERRISALCFMTNRIEISECLRGEIAVELVTGIHVKTVIRAIGIIAFVNLVDGMPVKKEEITAKI